MLFEVFLEGKFLHVFCGSVDGKCGNLKQYIPQCMLILRKPSFSAAYSVVHLAPAWSFGVCSNIVNVKLQANSA